MPQGSPRFFEVCVDTVDGVDCCQDHADRIELCSALGVGGLTPSAGLIAHARFSRIPVHAMIRPRTGDFAFSKTEVQVCLADIAIAKQAGLAGVVIGAQRGGHLDTETLKVLSDAAAGLEVTLHRVIDVTLDPVQGVKQAIDLGLTRILTSGGARQATDGLPVLRAMQAAAGDKIEIMVGSGVAANVVDLIFRETGIRSFHASCGAQANDDANAARLGFAETPRAHTDLGRIRALRAAIDQLDA